MGVEMELKVVKKDLQFASANSNTKVVDMVSPAPPYAPPAKFKQASIVRALVESKCCIKQSPLLGDFYMANLHMVVVGSI
jgi:hypothetical protein